MTLEMKDKSITCKHCGDIFEYKKSDIQYMYIHHPDSHSTDQVVYLNCPECGRRVEINHKD